MLGIIFELDLFKRRLADRVTTYDLDGRLRRRRRRVQGRVLFWGAARFVDHDQFLPFGVASQTKRSKPLDRSSIPPRDYGRTANQISNVEGCQAD